jgi:hypothetical protein
VVEPVVALYWDFENLHASLLDERDGSGAYVAARFRPQDPVVRLGAVMAHVGGIGRVAVNRAYGNWQWFGRYRHTLQAHGLDLVQLFPVGMGAKNGADIRLAVDVVSDLHRLAHVTHVVVVGGDSDYMAVAQRVRELGRSIIGIGADRSAHRHWRAVCDHFVGYGTLLGADVVADPDPDSVDSGDDVGEEAATSTRQAVMDLAVEAVRKLAAETGSRWVVKASVKPMLTRLDPAFDERRHGFATFNAFLAALSPRIVERVGTYDHEIALVEPGLIDLTDEVLPDDRLDRALRRAGIRLPERAAFWAIVASVAHQFTKAPTVSSFAELEAATAAALASEGVTAGDQAVRRARQALFKLHLFELLGEEVGVALAVAPEQLERAVLSGVVRQLGDQGVRADAALGEELATFLYGPEPSAERSAVLAEVLNAARPAGSG